MFSKYDFFSQFIKYFHRYQGQGILAEGSHDREHPKEDEDHPEQDEELEPGDVDRGRMLDVC